MSTIRRMSTGRTRALPLKCDLYGLSGTGGFASVFSKFNSFPTLYHRGKEATEGFLLRCTEERGRAKARSYRFRALAGDQIGRPYKTAAVKVLRTGQPVADPHTEIMY